MHACLACIHMQVWWGGVGVGGSGVYHSDSRNPRRGGGGVITCVVTFSKITISAPTSAHRARGQLHGQRAALATRAPPKFIMLYTVFSISHPIPTDLAIRAYL